eukprot:Selendium_serpulae@DN2013_c1_g1_i1.p1
MASSSVKASQAASQASRSVSMQRFHQQPSQSRAGIQSSQSRVGIQNSNTRSSGGTTSGGAITHNTAGGQHAYRAPQNVPLTNFQYGQLPPQLSLQITTPSFTAIISADGADVAGREYALRLQRIEDFKAGLFKTPSEPPEPKSATSPGLIDHQAAASPEDIYYDH